MIVSDYTALISEFSWNGGYGQEPSGQPVFLSYSFADRFLAESDLSFIENPSFFRPLNAVEQQAFRTALDQWASVSGIVLLQAPAGLGDIEVGVYDLSANIAGLAYYALPSFFYDNGEATLFNTNLKIEALAGNVYLDGSLGLDLHVMLHEIGHALGLAHTHDGARILTPDLDRGFNTVMGYNEPRLGTLGPFDEQAIQALYGGPDQDGTHVQSWSWNAASATLTQVGTGASEIITGIAAHDIVYGGGGDDLIATRGGNDTIYLVGSNGQISAGSGLDILVVTFDSAQLSDTFSSGSGDDRYLLISDGGVIAAFSVERVAFTDRTLAYDIDGVAGQVYRLYQAAFARTPDDGGLAYWIDQADQGLGLIEIGAGFMASREFVVLYQNALTTSDFVNQLYNNILGRDGDEGGLSFWSGALETGVMDEATVLTGFSESPENIARVAPDISDGIWYA